MTKLRRAWTIWIVIGISGLSAAAWGLSSLWGTQYALRWLISSGAVFIYQAIYLYRCLDENRDSSGRLFPHLGPANWLTVGRGALLALVAGFLFVPRPEGWLEWVPAGLYLTAMLIDYADGYMARISGIVTRLGSRLDMHFDVHGYLIGGILAVAWGQAPVWYLLVALARPFYVLGEWILAHRGQTPRALYPNPFRRVMSAAQMGFTAVLIFPVFTPPGTIIAATVYMLPFLTNFLLDWLWVSGVLPDAFIHSTLWRSRWVHTTRTLFPLIMRVVLSGFLFARALGPGLDGPSLVFIQILHGLLILAILTGTVGRVFAVGAMLLSGFYLREVAADWLAWGILFTAFGVFFGGTGRFSLWTPEDWLIYRIAGEKKQA
jgi:CDP-diacylglycerol---glycerol-3-phosphate 3-phosphatidyltransferase